MNDFDSIIKRMTVTHVRPHSNKIAVHFSLSSAPRGTFPPPP